MNYCIDEPGPSLSEEGFRAFEVRHGISFPADYRRFMLEYNGGMPEPDHFVSKEGLEAQIFQFDPIGANEPYDLDNRIFCSDWPEALDEGIVRIGRDAGGSHIFICTKEDAGAIYFLDREELIRPPSGYVRLASSFTELMDGLVE
jgi:hypothetical protein